MRDDETGKRALFSSAQSGRGGRRPPDPRRQTPIAVDCSRCGATTRLTVRDAVARLGRISLWVPGRTYSRRLTCPACERRSWVRMRLL